MKIRFSRYAPVAQWIEQWFPVPCAGVRFPSGVLPGTYVQFRAVIISTVSIYGVLSAGNIHTTKYNISVDKKAGNMKELNVVLIADLHLGYNIG